MKIGKKIAFYRKKMELTQEELAEQLEISSQAVSNWETEQNNPDEDVLIKLADIFNVTLDDLFDRKVSLFPWEDDDTLRAVVFVGHRMVKKEDMDETLLDKCSKITIEYDGDVKNVESYFNVECENVEGNVTAGGDVECEDVEGNVTAGGDVECEEIEGNVVAGGDVECEEIEGNIIAGGNVKYEEKDEDEEEEDEE
jgi:transcriptional regulator with XRE-family HTH domain